MYHEIAQQTALKSPWATLSLSCMKKAVQSENVSEQERRLK